ncbi:MAG: M1 family aminopeptidase [Bacteroidota bacterium]|nr:M1 family aminopeptidase [Bacteroidota bacterium]MDP4229514.1 M1 family aminopeptidase [Bacteroidota bacterium]MDP4235865.1 M1 family aminopeptidase [Bacteroidota bacterium]
MLRFFQFFVAFAFVVIASGSLPAQQVAIPNSEAKGYDVTSYDATIWLNREQNRISGQVDMTATSMGDLSVILQHAKFLQIDSVFVGGIRSAIQVVDTGFGTYVVTGFPPYHNGSIFTERTYYHGNGTPETGSNPWGGVQDTGGMMFAMGVGFTAPYVSCTRHWLPCYDEPDDKADSVTLRFFADTSGIVVSNGLQTASLVETDGRTTFCEWKISHPIATYLLTFAFGPFKHLSIPNPLNIPFDVYAFAKDTAKLRDLMQKRVVEGLVYFDSLYAPYPFEKVGYVVAPIGSMEHQTMITLAGQTIDTNNTTAVHELSHQWWGDKVTCADFNDPWLNEGFATYSESLFQERFFGEGKYWSRQHSNILGALAASEDTIALYGAPFHTSPRNNYPPVIYQKGAAVLGMLRYFLGDTAFFSSIRAYGRVNAYSNATSDDLAEAFVRTTHQDLSWFFKKWVYGTGHPIFNIIWSRNATTATMNIVQAQDPERVGYFRLPLIVESRAANGGKIERHEIQLDSVRVNEITFPCSFIPDTLVIDPDGAVIKKIVGPIKFGVLPSKAASKNMYPMRLQFNPNPSHGKSVTLSLPGQKITITNQRSSELQIFDSNGNSVSIMKPGPFSANSSTHVLESSLDTTSLASGTYFAILLFNDAIVGEGQFVVSK